MMPTRIQRKRTKGWRMPEGAVYVGRPSKWGNPYSIDRLGLDEYVARLLDGADPHDVARAALARHGATDPADMHGLDQDPPPQPRRRQHDDERALPGRRERG